MFCSEGMVAGMGCKTLACALGIRALRIVSRKPDRSGGLPRLSLLRTVRATFTAYGSSTLKVTKVTRQYNIRRPFSWRIFDGNIYPTLHNMD